MNIRKTIPAIALAATLSVPALGAAAPVDGFAPWARAATAETPDAVQAEVAVRPWGVDAGNWPNARGARDVTDTRQAQVVVRPWYIPGAI